MLTNVKAFSLIRKNLKAEYFSSHLARKTISFFFKACSKGDNKSAPKLLGLIDDKEISGFVSKILMDDDIPLDKNSFRDSLFKLYKRGTMQVKKKLQDEIKQAELKGDKKRLKELIKEYGRVNNEVRSD